MQVNLFDKEGQVSTSSVYFAYKILKVFNKRKTNRLSFFKLFKFVKEMNPAADPKQVFYGLMFLRVAGLVNVEDVYVVTRVDNA